VVHYEKLVSSADLLSVAPFSEMNGRRLPMLLLTVGFALFMIAIATSKDIQTVLICRFFSSAFASAPLAVTGAVITSMFEFLQRGTAAASLVVMLFLGPIISLVIDAFTSENPGVGVS
jgi:DHA1 family multidrug resistance protein-like MFS transporter